MVLNPGTRLERKFSGQNLIVVYRRFEKETDNKNWVEIGELSSKEAMDTANLP